MNFTSCILLILFVFFQFSTSIICLVQNCQDTNINYFDQDEEDENFKETKESKEIKEMKSYLLTYLNFDFNFLAKNKTNKIEVLYLIAEYKTDTTITILPPEIV